MSCGFLLLVMAEAGALGAANLPPAVEIPGITSLQSGSAILLADAKDMDGSISKVDFYVDGALVGTSTEPYSGYYRLLWRTSVYGSHSVYGVAWDDLGATNVSAPFTFHMPGPVRLLTPTNGSVFSIYEPISLSAEVESPGGPVAMNYSVSRVPDSWSYSLSPTALTNPPYLLVVSNLSDGEWQVSASWGYGSASTRFRIDPVREVPEFVTHPTNQLAAPGSQVVLRASAASSFTQTYQWLFNGSPLPGATNADHSITNVQAAHAGYYCVIASNSVGVACSSLAYLSVSVTNPATIRFSNLDYGGFPLTTNLDIPVPPYFAGGGTPSYAKLWVGAKPDALMPLATTSIRRGYFRGGDVQLPMIAAGEKAYVQILLVEPNFNPYPYVSNRFPLETSTNGPTLLTGLVFRAYIEWPHPDVLGGAEHASAVIGKALTIHKTVWSYGEGYSRFQWYKNGLAVPGASGTYQVVGYPPGGYRYVILQLPNISFHDVGAYKLMVCGDWHTSISEPTFINVAEPISGRMVNTTVESNVFAASLHGRLGSMYHVEHSTNLVDWEPLIFGTNDGNFLLQAPITNTPRRFFRSRLQP